MHCSEDMDIGIINFRSNCLQRRNTETALINAGKYFRKKLWDLELPEMERLMK